MNVLFENIAESSFALSVLTVSLIFLVIGLIFLVSAIIKKRAAEKSEKKEINFSFFLILIFIVLTIGIVSSGFIYYRNYEKPYRREVEKQLSAISDLKARELVQWRKERLADASVYYRNDNFTHLIKRFFYSPGDMDARKRLRVWLTKVREAYQYDELLILNNQGRVMMSYPDRRKSEPSFSLNAKGHSVNTKVTFLDFHRHGPDQPIILEILLPVIEENGSRNPIGMLIFQINPETYLYPLIQRWPVESRTGETLIVRKDGGDVLFLNELKFRKNTALNLRFPLNNSLDLPAAMAVQGVEGIVQGRDYRGVPVIASVRAIPDSPWFMVARMDKSEVYAPLRERLWLIILIVCTLLMGTGAGVGFIWRHHRSRFYREKYEAAKALQASEDRHRKTLDTMMEGCQIIDFDWRYLYVNDATLCHGRRASEELLGRTMMEAYPGIEYTEMFAELKRCMENRIPGHMENEFVYASGDSAWFELSIQPVPEGIFILSINLTERKRAEQELNIRNKIGEIFLTIPDGKMYYEVMQVFLSAMKSEFGTFGYIDENGDLVVPTMTRHVWDECRIKDKDIVFPRESWGNSSWPRCLREKKAIVINKPSLLTPKGHITMTRHISQPIIHQGKPIGLMQVANKETDYDDNDIQLFQTIADAIAPVLNARLQKDRAMKALEEHRGQLEDLVDERTAEIQLYAAQLEAANKELEASAYSVSHDLRAPLRRMDGFSGALLETYKDRLDEKGKHYLERVRAGAADMGGLIDDLLNLSRITRSKVERKRVNLSKIVHSIVRELRKGAEEERNVLFNIQDDVAVMGDQRLLTVLLRNLLGNSWKFTGKKENTRISFGVKVDGISKMKKPDMPENIPVYFVRDNGAGFDLAYAEKLFGAFQRLHRTDEFEGTGIGLATAQRIVHKHGGIIWAEGEVGKGACFYFTLS